MHALFHILIGATFFIFAFLVYLSALFEIQLNILSSHNTISTVSEVKILVSIICGTLATYLSFNNEARRQMGRAMAIVFAIALVLMVMVWW